MPNTITYLDHAVDVLAQVKTYVKTQQRFALITSVDIKGGSARDIGSLAVVCEAGNMTGYMSNGCIDRDIALHASDCLRSGTARLLRYGEGSAFHDLTLPCGGSLSIWIDPAPDLTTLLAAHDALTARRPASLTFRPEARYITIAYQPKVTLCLAGRGAIFRATARGGKATGFDIQAYSPDLTDLEAVATHCAEPPTHMRSIDNVVELNLAPTSGVLTLFHDHDWEPAFLTAALATPAGFIGALGSQKTQTARLAHLAEKGISEHDLKRVRGPIGLVPSLRDANLIAVSALAEVAQAFAYDQQKIIDA
ncbi:XdhC family protein [Pseudosulfitobacter sp. SM2401]|uniref:XdhC family protein n=1 Tax=Pseudosulfitobacter sp. SM2401 TaxID=3350098 RepID=UPI0036F247B2